MSISSSKYSITIHHLFGPSGPRGAEHALGRALGRGGFVPRPHRLHRLEACRRQLLLQGPWDADAVLVGRCREEILGEVRAVLAVIADG